MESHVTGKRRKNPFLVPHYNPGRRAHRRTAPIQRRRRLPVEPCPPRSIACRSRPKHEFLSKCFNSIREARAFLEYKVPEMSDEECARNAEIINAAEKMVRRADRRNQKRKMRRVTSPRLPGIQRSQYVPAPPRPKKRVAHYEEVFGPNGEVIRYKLIYRNDQFIKRIRTKEDPPVGSIILDLTSGVKAWKRHSDKRRSMPLTSEMQRSYKNSYLYKVRQLASGNINREQFIKLVTAKPGVRSSGWNQ